MQLTEIKSKDVLRPTYYNFPRHRLVDSPNHRRISSVVAHNQKSCDTYIDTLQNKNILQTLSSMYIAICHTMCHGKIHIAY